MPVNSTVSVVGHLATSSGAPIANHRVWLIERLAGQSTASQVGAWASPVWTDRSTLVTPPLTHSVRLRLVTGQHVHSAAIGVVVMPTVTAVAVGAGHDYVVNVTTDGGDPGDTVDARAPDRERLGQR